MGYKLHATSYTLQVTSYNRDNRDNRDKISSVFCSSALLPFCFSAFLLFCFLSISAQRIEIHGIKELSNNSTANKAWGVGGAVLFDQWVKKTTFGAHFDWTTYRSKNKETHPNFNRMSGGISTYYSLNLTKKISLQCGAEFNFTNIKYSHIHRYEKIDSLSAKAVTLLQTGNFIGIGAHIGVNCELSKRFGLKINVIPTYLISVGSKSSLPDVKPEYAKGMWIFPLQLGITYKIFNLKE